MNRSWACCYYNYIDDLDDLLTVLYIAEFMGRFKKRVNNEVLTNYSERLKFRMYNKVMHGKAHLSEEVEREIIRSIGMGEGM